MKVSSPDYRALKSILEVVAQNGILLIEGGKRLEGELRAQGSKNGALPLIAATVMLDAPITLKRVNPIRDIRVMVDIFEKLGGTYHFSIDEEELFLDPSVISSHVVPWGLAKEIHASFDYLGALLFRYGVAEVPLPGGCVLGTRAVDIHLEGLRALGAEVTLENGLVRARADRLKGTTYRLRRQSVGATKNLVMAALRAEEPVILENVSIEPEVKQLVEFMRSCGAQIEELSTYVLKVYPHRGLLHSPGYFENMPDRIEAGTYVLAVLATGGEITIRDVIPEHLDALNSVLREVGVHVEVAERTISYYIRGELKPVEVVTEPYPGFPTDLQPPMVAFLTRVPGRSVVRETIFNNRFSYVPELLRLGAEVELIDNYTAIVHGGNRLRGAPMVAPDIRAGAALVIGALMADGISQIENYLMLDRGYWKLDEKLRTLGASAQLSYKGGN